MPNGAGMRNASMLRTAVLSAAFVGAALVATAATLTPAQAHERWPVIPEEIGIAPPPARLAWIPFRCSDGPADNFYHGAWYAGQPPALYHGRAYRPYYRYTAYRAVPRTYLCSH
jgi:hypothetical protein